MTQNRLRHGFPKSVRIVSSDDFGRVLRSEQPGVIRLGRDSVSVCALAHRQTGRVRFGFTVGKRNVPLSVDRALVKRVMREVARYSLPDIQKQCRNLDIGIDISLRYRSSLRTTGGQVTLSAAKRSVRRSAQLCLQALCKRLKSVAQAVYQTER